MLKVFYKFAINVGVQKEKIDILEKIRKGNNEDVLSFFQSKTYMHFFEGDINSKVAILNEKFNIDNKKDIQQLSNILYQRFAYNQTKRTELLKILQELKSLQPNLVNAIIANKHIKSALLNDFPVETKALQLSDDNLPQDNHTEKKSIDIIKTYQENKSLNIFAKALPQTIIDYEKLKSEKDFNKYIAKAKHIISKNFSDTAIKIALDFKHDKTFIKNFYQFLKDADRPMVEILSAEATITGSKLDKKYMQNKLSFFDAENNQNLLIALGPAVFDMFEKNELLQNRYIVKLVEAMVTNDKMISYLASHANSRLAKLTMHFLFEKVRDNDGKIKKEYIDSRIKMAKTIAGKLGKDFNKVVAAQGNDFASKNAAILVNMANENNDIFQGLSSSTQAFSELLPVHHEFFSDSSNDAKNIRHDHENASRLAFLAEAKGTNFIRQHSKVIKEELLPKSIVAVRVYVSKAFSNIMSVFKNFPFAHYISKKNNGLVAQELVDHVRHDENFNLALAKDDLADVLTQRCSTIAEKKPEHAMLLFQRSKEFLDKKNIKRTHASPIMKMASEHNDVANALFKKRHGLFLQHAISIKDRLKALLKVNSEKSAIMVAIYNELFNSAAELTTSEFLALISDEVVQDFLLKESPNNNNDELLKAIEKFFIAVFVKHETLYLNKKICYYAALLPNVDLLLGLLDKGNLNNIEKGQMIFYHLSSVKKNPDVDFQDVLEKVAKYIKNDASLINSLKEMNSSAVGELVTTLDKDDSKNKNNSLADNKNDDYEELHAMTTERALHYCYTGIQNLVFNFKKYLNTELNSPIVNQQEIEQLKNQLKAAEQRAEAAEHRAKVAEDTVKTLQPNISVPTSKIAPTIAQPVAAVAPPPPPLPPKPKNNTGVKDNTMDLIQKTKQERKAAGKNEIEAGVDLQAALYAEIAAGGKKLRPIKSIVNKPKACPHSIANQAKLGLKKLKPISEPAERKKEKPIEIDFKSQLRKTEASPAGLAVQGSKKKIIIGEASKEIIKAPASPLKGLPRSMANRLVREFRELATNKKSPILSKQNAPSVTAKTNLVRDKISPYFEKLSSREHLPKREDVRNIMENILNEFGLEKGNKDKYDFIIQVGREKNNFVDFFAKEVHDELKNFFKNKNITNSGFKISKRKMEKKVEKTLPFLDKATSKQLLSDIQESFGIELRKDSGIGHGKRVTIGYRLRAEDVKEDEKHRYKAEIYNEEPFYELKHSEQEDFVYKKLEEFLNNLIKLKKKPEIANIKEAINVFIKEKLGFTNEEIKTNKEFVGSKYNPSEQLKREYWKELIEAKRHFESKLKKYSDGKKSKKSHFFHRFFKMISKVKTSPSEELKAINEKAEIKHNISKIEKEMVRVKHIDLSLSGYQAKQIVDAVQNAWNLEHKLNVKHIFGLKNK